MTMDDMLVGQGILAADLAQPFVTVMAESFMASTENVHRFYQILQTSDESLAEKNMTVDRETVGIQLTLNRLIMTQTAGQLAMLAMLGCPVPELAQRKVEEEEEEEAKDS